MLNKIKQIFSQKLWTKCWTIGFVEGGIASIIKSDNVSVSWVKIPQKRWFADPFILDVSETEIEVLVEDFEYEKEKAVISLLRINRTTMKVCQRRVILDLPTHLSFPYIIRDDRRIFVCPENCQGEGLILYEFDREKELLQPRYKMCDDVVWDSVLTNCFDEPLLFTANKDDYHLDIYRKQGDKFVLHQTIVSQHKDSRMAGSVFKYDGKYYYPAQDCSSGYGEAVVIKEVFFKDGIITIGNIVKRIESPYKKMPLGFHTLNEYKGIAVVDACGYRYRRLVFCVLLFSKLKNYICKTCRK